MSGKGSARRPRQVPQKEYADNWDSVFKKAGRRLGKQSPAFVAIKAGLEDALEGHTVQMLEISDPAFEEVKDERTGDDSGAVGDPKQHK